MNSSLERANSSITPSAWSPADLSHASPQPRPEDIEQIESLFAAPLQQTLVSSHSSLIKDAAVITSAWNVGEVSRAQVIRKPTFRGSDLSSSSQSQSQSQSEAVQISNLEANSILTEAQRQADEIRAAAANDAESIRQKAYIEGQAAAKAELGSTLQAAAEMLEEFRQLTDEFFQNSEPMVLDLVKDIAKNLFGAGFNLDTQSLHETFGQALASARTFGALKVFLNPADVMRLDPNWIESQSLTYSQRIQFIASDDIQPGGCYVSGEQGAVDARVETRLHALMNALDEKVS